MQSQIIHKNGNCKLNFNITNIDLVDHINLLYSFSTVNGKQRLYDSEVILYLIVIVQLCYCILEGKHFIFAS